MEFGGLGTEPPAGSRGGAPGGGQEASPPEADDISKFEYLFSHLKCMFLLFSNKIRQGLAQM